MASPSRTAEREEERRLNVRTLLIASCASAAAAVCTSQLWFRGTWIAAAVTPVIVTLVSEGLNRPTEKLAKTYSDRKAVLPEAAGPAPPAEPEAHPLPVQVPEDHEAGAGAARPPRESRGTEERAGRVGAPGAPRRGERDYEPTGPISVYRAGSGAGGPPARRRKIAYGVVFGTAALAFVIAALALTIPELVTGHSITNRDRGSTIFGGHSRNNSTNESDTKGAETTTSQEQQAPQDTEQQTTPTEQSTTPEQTTPTPTTTPRAPPTNPSATPQSQQQQQQPQAP